MDLEQKTQTTANDVVAVIQYKSGKYSVGSKPFGIMEFWSERELTSFLSRNNFTFKIREATKEEENIE